MLEASDLRLTAALTVSPEGTQDGNRMPIFKQSAAAATPDGAP